MHFDDKSHSYTLFPVARYSFVVVIILLLSSCNTLASNPLYSSANDIRHAINKHSPSFESWSCDQLIGAVELLLFSRPLFSEEDDGGFDSAALSPTSLAAGRVLTVLAKHEREGRMRPRLSQRFHVLRALLHQNDTEVLRDAGRALTKAADDNGFGWMLLAQADWQQGLYTRYVANAEHAALSQRICIYEEGFGGRMLAAIKHLGMDSNEVRRHVVGFSNGVETSRLVIKHTGLQVFLPAAARMYGHPVEYDGYFYALRYTALLIDQDTEPGSAMELYVVLAGLMKGFEHAAADKQQKALRAAAGEDIERTRVVMRRIAQERARISGKGSTAEVGLFLENTHTWLDRIKESASADEPNAMTVQDWAKKWLTVEQGAG